MNVKVISICSRCGKEAVTVFTKREELKRFILDGRYGDNPFTEELLCDICTDTFRKLRDELDARYESAINEFLMVKIT